MEERNWLESLINKALDMLYERDFSLIKRRLHEQCIVFRFALYLHQLIQDTEFAVYDLDLEYNKNGIDNKRIQSKPNGARPDLILHKRECNDCNILMLEFKYANNTSGNKEDKNKLKDFRSNLGEYKYKFAASIIFSNKRDNIIIDWV